MTQSGEFVPTLTPEALDEVRVPAGFTGRLGTIASLESLDTGAVIARIQSGQEPPLAIAGLLPVPETSLLTAKAGDGQQPAYPRTSVDAKHGITAPQHTGRGLRMGLYGKQVSVG
jgi:hypothetical protein